MIFVVGGAYQGKTRYVQENYGSEYKVLENYHLTVRGQLEAGLDPIEEWEKFAQELLGSDVCQDMGDEQKTLLGENALDKVIIISCDLGSGLVPIEPFEREYREQVGRVNCLIAGKATQVIRVISGIGTKIK